jgi:hypothetical protein
MHWLKAQPIWSDLPVILLTLPREVGAQRPLVAEQVGNVTILGTPAPKAGHLHKRGQNRGERIHCAMS